MCSTSESSDEWALSPLVDGITYAAAPANPSCWGPATAARSTATRQPSRPTNSTTSGCSHRTSRSSRVAPARYSSLLSSLARGVARLTMSVMPTRSAASTRHGSLGRVISPLAVAAFQNRLDGPA